MGALVDLAGHCKGSLVSSWQRTQSSQLVVEVGLGCLGLGVVESTRR